MTRIEPTWLRTTLIQILFSRIIVCVDITIDTVRLLDKFITFISYEELTTHFLKSRDIKLPKDITNSNPTLNPRLRPTFPSPRLTVRVTIITFCKTSF